MCQFEPDVFNREIAGHNWNMDRNLDSIDEIVSDFNFSFMEILNRHMPFIKKRVYEDQAPWVSNELLSLIGRRECLTSKNQKCPCTYHLELRKDAIKAAYKLNLSLKREYIAHDARQLWRAIRELWPGNMEKNHHYPRY